MNREEWKKQLVDAMIEAGTYRAQFGGVIDTLADMLERRDEAQALFRECGGSVVQEHTNKAGATNMEQNPISQLLNVLNRDCLAYFRELGLTPAGLKRINENAFKGKRTNALAEALKELGG